MRLRGPASRRLDATVLGLSLLAALGVWAIAPLPAIATLRERAFDRLSAAAWPERPPFPAVVAIDRTSLAALGPWPWARDRLARRGEATAAAGPAAIGIDILLEGPDTGSPAALARRLGALAGLPEIARRAGTLPDGDARLADALGRAPSVLGLAPDPRPGPPPTGLAPILATGPLDGDRLWRAP
ncbi:MAG: CHASE2 domain-containing protein, partial [Paracoccaceae bacterium]